jgi:glutamine amidotransferase
MTVLIVDYGMGNLHSVERAFSEQGAETVISADPAAIATAAGIVIPGVGSFAEGMGNLRASGMAAAIIQAAREEAVPVLGICLGMQLLASRGLEGGDTPGLDLIPGEVRPLAARPGERIPHVGWNGVNFTRDDGIGFKLRDDSDFYFVHSYAFTTENPGDVIAETTYGGGFTSIVGRGSVRGVQFHPERSAKAGARLIQNFLTLCQG